MFRGVRLLAPHHLECKYWDSSDRRKVLGGIFERDRLRPFNASFSALFSILYVMLGFCTFGSTIQ